MIGLRGCFVSSRSVSNTVPTLDVPLQIKSAYIGRDKATVENNLKFVSACHKYSAAAVYCLPV